jgi:transposase
MMLVLGMRCWSRWWPRFAELAESQAALARAAEELARVARPNREVRHEPGCCGRCGTGLGGRPVTGVERRQAFDLPEVTVTVTDHQLIERECGCGHRTKAAAPQGAEAPLQYGPRIAATIVYLYIGQFLSKKRTAQALAELFGIPLSSGTVAALTFEVRSGSAGCGLTCQLTVPAVAGRGLIQAGICGRWLPVWLPRIR